MADNNSIVANFDDEKNDDLQITLETIPTIESGCLITLKGMIDTYNSSFFQSQITKVITAGYINIVFKCTYLDYIASTGLGNFTNLRKLIKAVNGDFVIADVQPKIEEESSFSEIEVLEASLPDLNFEDTISQNNSASIVQTPLKEAQP